MRQSRIGRFLCIVYGIYLLVLSLIGLTSLSSLAYCGPFGGLIQLLFLLPASILIFLPFSALAASGELCENVILWITMRVLLMILSAMLNLLLCYLLGRGLEGLRSWLRRQANR